MTRPIMDLIIKFSWSNKKFHNVANNISDNKDNSFFSLVAEIKKLKSNECVVVKYDKKYIKYD